jgi:hypothetical protein
MENTTEVATASKLSDQEIQNIYDYAAMQLSDGRSKEEVIDMVVSRGIDRAHAPEIVSSLRQQIAQMKVDRANKDITHGALWFGGGLLVTVGSYSMASNGGGSYLMCWGAIIFGGYQLLKGMVAIGGAKQALAEASE